MRRYFFHVHDGSKTLDEEGELYPDDGAARRYGLRAISDILRSVRAGNFRDEAPWTLHIVRDAEHLVGHRGLGLDPRLNRRIL